jgi:hypothetical protein
VINLELVVAATSVDLHMFSYTQSNKPSSGFLGFNFITGSLLAFASRGDLKT